MTTAALTALAQDLSLRWLPTLLDASLKGLALLTLAGLAVALMRRASAAARQLVWFAAITATLLLPVFSAALPDWRILPAWAHVTFDRPAETPAPEPANPQPSPIAVAPPTFSEPPMPTVPAVSDSARPDPSAALHALPPAAAPPVPEPAKPPMAQPSAMARALPWAMACWALGALLCLAPVLLGWLSLWRLRCRCRRVTDPAWLDLLARAGATLGLHRRVILLESDRRPMPMIWGLFQHKLLVPAEAAAWPADRRWVVLLHELGHAKRWDCLTRLIAHLACALYWFNPLAWLALFRLQNEAERACDDLVLAVGSRPADYAEHVLHIASGLQSPSLSIHGAIAMARPSRLEGRLLAILDPRRNRRSLTRLALLLAAAALLAVAIPIAILRAQPTATEGRLRLAVWTFDKKTHALAGFAKGELAPGGELSIETTKGHAFKFKAGALGTAEIHDRPGGPGRKEAAVDLTVSHGKGSSEGSVLLSEPELRFEYGYKDPVHSVVLIVPAGAIPAGAAGSDPMALRGNAGELDEVLLGWAARKALSPREAVDAYGIAGQSSAIERWRTLTKAASTRDPAVAVLARLGDDEGTRLFARRCLDSRGNEQISLVALIPQMPSSPAMLDAIVQLIEAKREYVENWGPGVAVADLDRRSTLIETLLEKYAPHQVRPYGPRLLAWAKTSGNAATAERIRQFLDSPPPTGQAAPATQPSATQPATAPGKPTFDKAVFVRLPEKEKVTAVLAWLKWREAQLGNVAYAFTENSDNRSLRDGSRRAMHRDWYSVKRAGNVLFLQGRQQDANGNIREEFTCNWKGTLGRAFGKFQGRIDGIITEDADDSNFKSRRYNDILGLRVVQDGPKVSLAQWVEQLAQEDAPIKVLLHLNDGEILVAIIVAEGSWSMAYFLDPKRDMMPVRFQYWSGNPVFNNSAGTIVTDSRQVDGFWVPMRVFCTSGTTASDEETEITCDVKEFTRGNVTEKDCEVVFPPGTKVTNLIDRTVNRVTAAGTMELVAPLPLEQGPAVGYLAAPFEAQTLDGKTIKLADYRGKFILLSFWAVQSRSCVAMTPKLKALYETFGKDPRFVMIGLSANRDMAAVKEFVAKNDMRWPQCLLGGEKGEMVALHYRANALPTLILISPDGKILARDQAVHAALPKALAAQAALPASQPAGKEDPGEVAEAFLRALDAGQYETAKALTLPRTVKTDGFPKLREVFDLSAVRVKKVLVSDTEACIVTSAFSFRKEGRAMTMGLKLMRNGDRWLVRDVDALPTGKSIADFVEGFRKANPNAVTQPARPVPSTPSTRSGHTGTTQTQPARVMSDEGRKLYDAAVADRRHLKMTLAWWHDKPSLGTRRVLLFSDTGVKPEAENCVQAPLTPEQAGQLVEVLADLGYFKRAIDFNKYNRSYGDLGAWGMHAPCYALELELERGDKTKFAVFEPISDDRRVREVLQAFVAHLDGQPRAASASVLAQLPRASATQPASSRIPALIGQLGRPSASRPAASAPSPEPQTVRQYDYDYQLIRELGKMDDMRGQPNDFELIHKRAAELEQQYSKPEEKAKICLAVLLCHAASGNRGAEDALVYAQKASTLPMQAVDRARLFLVWPTVLDHTRRGTTGADLARFRKESTILRLRAMQIAEAYQVPEDLPPPPGRGVSFGTPQAEREAIEKERAEYDFARSLHLFRFQARGHIVYYYSLNPLATEELADLARSILGDGQVSQSLVQDVEKAIQARTKPPASPPVSTAPAPSGPATQPAAGRIPALVGQLGSASAKEREEAQKKLVEIGPPKADSAQSDSPKSGEAPSSQTQSAEALEKLGAQASLNVYKEYYEVRWGADRGARKAATDEQLALLKTVEPLGMLDLTGAPVSDAGLAHLAGLENLRRLILDETKITDAGLARLAGLAKLEHLSLKRTAVTDEGLDHVLKLPALRGLAVSGLRGAPGPAGITDAGLAKLKALKALTYLSVNNPRTSPNDARPMEPCGDQITDAGLEHLKTMAGLTQLRLGGTKITDAGLATIGQMANLSELGLVTPAVTDKGLAALKGLGQLHVLELSCDGITDEGLAHLKPMAKLGVLMMLRCPGIKGAGLAHLADLPDLNEIFLTPEEGFDVRELGRLASIKPLRLLWLYNLHLDGPQADQFVEAVSRLKQVAVLSIRQSQVPANLAERLRKSLPRTAVEVELPPAPSTQPASARIPALIGPLDSPSAKEPIGGKKTPVGFGAIGALVRDREDSAKWQIDTLVDERDILKVAVGQEVDFTLEAMPRRAFKGKVVQVGDKPIPQPNQVIYKAIIQIANPEVTFKPGMSANVTFPPIGSLKAMLPSGAEIELVALSRYPDRNQPFWRPDGARLDEPPFDTTVLDVTSVNDPKRQKIELVFRVSGKAPEPGYESQIWRTDGGGHWWAGRRSKAGQFLPDLKIMGISVPADMQTLSLDLRAAAGPWQSETSDGLQAKGRLSAAKDAPNYTEQSALITARVDTEKEDTQVVAIDRDGIRHVSRPVDTRGTDDVAEADFVFPRLTPANIKSFTLETRPYEMIHLKDISLVPGRYADAEVTSGPPQSQPSATRIPALIGQLGSPSAKEREEAQKALVEIGEPALEALKAAAADKDVERAARAKQAIETIHDEMRLDAILADVGSVHVDLQYYASNTAGSPYWRLTFVSNSGPPYVGPGSGPWKVARMPAEQLTRLLKHLRAAGFFQRAVGWEALDISSRQPCYVIRVMHGQSQYYESLGWGLPMLQRLEALRKHLDGDPANAMDKLLTALEPKRHEWSPPARSTPSGPTTQPAAGRIPALIGQLGSASAKEREEAQMALVEIGPEAVKPLRKVAAGADVEAALRAKAALTGIGRKAIGQPYDAWAAYTAATDFLLKNGSRVEAADRFMTVAEMEPDDRNAWCREMSAELGPMLEQMAREDAAFRESPDAKGLRGRQRLDYLVFKLRDVAERELMEPGRCQVLFSKRDNAAWALRTLGKEAVPTLIELLDDRRPTRSSGGALNGGYVLRYADVSLQILEAIAARNFDRQSSGRGTCLTNPGDKAQAMIREVKDWWQRNKDKAESQWVREALAENGIGAMWDSLQWAERLIELEGPACADFFRERMKAEPGNDHIPRFLREALASPPSTGSGQSGSPQTQPAAAQVPALIEQLGSASAKEREEAQKALVEIGEPGLEALKAAAEDKDAERAMRAKQAAAEITERMRPASRVGLFLMDVPIGVEDAERAPLAKLRLAKAPILCAEDIAEYGWDNHVIYLTAAGLRRLPDMRQGSLPFVMVADGQRCYLGQFYSPLSSYPASVPTIALELGAPRNPIRIHIPIAGANDPRGDPRIQKALRELGKLKSPATNPATQPAAGRIPALIGQLASASAKEREEAQKALVEIGPEAVAPLKAATQDKDLERSGRAVTALREMEDSLWSTAWCRAPGAGARDRIKLSLLPEDQRQEEGRWAILAETTKQSVEKLAEDTSLPLGAQTDPPIDPLELTLANFRVQKLVGRARRSEQVRREVVAAALSIIREYVGRPDPSQVLGRDSFTKGWRSGYDCLLAVLTLTDEKGDGLQAAMNAFARHQAEIGRPLDKVTPQYGRWPVGGYGHNEYFFMYLDQALVAYAQHGNLPEQANAILQRYVADRQKDRKANYVCAEKKLVVAYPYGLGNTFGTAMELQKVMLESGAWKEPRPSPDTVRPGSPQTQPAAGRIPALIGTRAAPARAGEP